MWRGSPNSWRNRSPMGDRLCPGPLRPVRAGSGGARIPAGPGLSVRAGGPVPAVLHAGGGAGDQGARGAGGQPPGLCPSALLPDDQPPGKRVWECFTREGVKPNVFFTAPSTAQTLPMCSKGTVRLLLHPHEPGGQPGTGGQPCEHFSSLGPGSPPGAESVAAAAQAALSDPLCQVFMELLFQSASSLEQLPIRWIVEEPQSEYGVEKPVGKRVKLGAWGEKETIFGSFSQAKRENGDSAFAASAV